jgi:hypothetical protein
MDGGSWPSQKNILARILSEQDINTRHYFYYDRFGHGKAAQRFSSAISSRRTSLQHAEPVTAIWFSWIDWCDLRFRSCLRGLLVVTRYFISSELCGILDCCSSDAVAPHPRNNCAAAGLPILHFLKGQIYGGYTKQAAQTFPAAPAILQGLRFARGENHR